MSKPLRIAIRKFPPFESAIAKMWAAYCAEYNCDLPVEMVPLELHDLHEATLGKGGLKNGDWDIAIINTDWIAEAYEQEALADLSPFIKQNPPEDFPGGWPTSLLGMQQFSDAVLGLPFHDGPECLIYRKDLFENPAEQAAFQKYYGRPLQVPVSWDEFEEVAAFFTRPEEGLYGTAFAAYPDGHNTVFDFCLQLWTRGGSLISEDGKIKVDSVAAIEGMEFYRRVLADNKMVHPDSSKFESVALGMAFARGEVAMTINWFGFAAMCEVIPESKVKGKVDITDIPKGADGVHASLNVYYMYVLGAGSSHKDIAYDFMRYAVGKTNDKLLTLEGAIGCRLSTWHDEEINATIPYYHKLEALHQHAQTLPRDANWTVKAAIVDELVTNVINTNTPVAQLAASAQIKLDQLYN